MAGQSRRPLRRRLQARAFRVLNVPMRALLALPVATPAGLRLMLVSFTGRTTGRAYRQPVSYVTDGPDLLTPGGGRWTLNLEGGAPVRLRLRGREVSARPELVCDPGEVGRLLERMMAVNPRLRVFVGIPRGPGGHLDPAGVAAAVQHGFRVVRWHLDPAPAAASARGSAKAPARTGPAGSARPGMRKSGDCQLPRRTICNGA